MNFGTPLRIGIISDTHGLLCPEIAEIFDGVTHILHAGDVGDISILAALSEIAPVTAVRGNTDVAPGCRNLPAFETVRLSSAEIFLHHGHLLDPLGDEFPATANVIVSGHTHVPAIHWIDGGVLAINPGSAGPRRFRLPASVAVLTIFNRARSVEFVELPV